MKKIKWGLIGTGSVTEVKSGPGLYKIENSELVGVYNRTHEKALDYASRHGINTVYQDVSEMLLNDEIDVVYIATPPVSHKEYAVRVLRNNKIPYIEKPVTMTYEEALEIKRVANKVKLPVYVAFYRRGLEKFIKIKQLLDEHKIGNIKAVHVTQTARVTDEYLDRNHLPWRVKPEISGGGLFMDIGSHVLDTLQMFFGKFESMSGYAMNTGGYYDAEDTVVASFKFKNDIVGTGEWCFVADEFKNEVTIIGDKGRIIYDSMSAKSFTLIVDGVKEDYHFEKPEHIAMPYEQTVIDELLDIKKSYASFDEAINLVEMMEQVLKSYYNQP
jgi:predicted dehydrogenase